MEGALAIIPEDKARIQAYRFRGYGYRRIAAELNLPMETVKAFCKRDPYVDKVMRELMSNACPQCGKAFDATSRRKTQKFCSESCRRQWWRKHPSLSLRKAYYPCTCQYCGTLFQSYGNQKRKFCSHGCYIAQRYPKERTDSLEV